jgi:hypothetical protein
METTVRPEQHGPIHSILRTLAWMIVAFIGGIFVGSHQEWVPNMPWAWHPDFDQTPLRAPQVPATQPAEDNSMVAPQTQPTPTVH